MMLRIVILFIVLYSVLCCNAQDSAFINQILQRIASQQIVSDRYFLKGNISSYISNKKTNHPKKKDDNIFFAALINVTLRQQYKNLSPANRLLADSIQVKSEMLYMHFQNKKGRLTYNFWRTDTAIRFPYTNWIHLIKKNTSLPDDMDDTVLSLLAQNADSARAAEAHHIMQAYVNHGDGNASIEKKYRTYNAYSVWYGKNFPPVFDVCVLSNILFFVEQYHLAWTAADSASLRVIVKSVKDNDYINQPIYVSPYYGKTSLILYHLARLMNGTNIPELEALQSKLIATAVEQYSHTNDLLEKMILCTAIMKWGYVAPELNLKENKETLYHIETSHLPFFTGNIPSYFPVFYKHVFTQHKWLLFYHYCPAYNDVLLLEYLLLKKKITSNENRNT